MPGPYASILRAPGVRPLVAASLLARLSFGLVDLALIVLVQREAGSFALSGAVVAANAAGIAASAPVRGRLLDRLGTRRLVPAMAVANATSILVVLALAHLDLPVLFVAVSFAGGVVTPPLVPAMRLEWQRLLGLGTRDLERAYAFETTAQIGVFLVGPLLAGAALATIGPDAPLVVSSALMLVGGPLFAVRAEARPDVHRERTRGLGSIGHQGVLTLVLVTLLADTALGSVDLGVVAAATAEGHPAAGGILLAAFTTGAVIGATVYGTRAWRQPASRRLVAVLGAYALVLAVLAAVEPLTLFGFGLVLIAAGVPSAAQWTTASVVPDDVAPAGQAAEAYTWLSSANAAGIALGGVIAGSVIDARGVPAAFGLAAGAAALAAGVLLARRGSVAAGTGVTTGR